jgi:hypothetical protein
MKIVTALLPVLASAHICILDPPQRGGPSIKTWGDHQCFNAGSAELSCGDATRFPHGTPHQFIAGSSIDILFQQNLNHYNPGFEGFLDVAYSTKPDPTDADFVTLASVPDTYLHKQASMTNYTLPVTLPLAEFTGGSLRVRYHPNKPTEPVFRQCADISIVAPTAAEPGVAHAASKGTVRELLAREAQAQGTSTAAATAPNASAAHGMLAFVKFAAPETVANAVPVRVGERSGALVPAVSAPRAALADGIVAVDSARGVAYFLAQDTEQLAEGLAVPANQLFSYDLATGAWGEPVRVDPPPQGSWASLLHRAAASGDQRASLLGVAQVPAVRADCRLP